MNITVANIQRTILLTQCVNTIIQENILQKDYVNLVNGRNRYDFVAVQTNYFKNWEVFHMGRKPTFYVFEEGDHEELYDLVEMMVNTTNYDFNPRATFIFVASSFPKRFLDLIWFHFLMKAVFLNTRNGELWTYTFRNLTEVDEKLRKLGSCSRVIEDGSLNLLPIQEMKRDWKESRVTVLVHMNKVYTSCLDCELRGIEIEIFEMIFKHLKINFEFRVSERHIQGTNEFISDYDAYIGALLHSDRDFVMDNTISYVEEKVALFVPREKPLPRWKYLFRVFSFTSWILWIFSLVALAVVFAAPGSTFSGRTKSFRDLSVGVLKLILEQEFDFTSSRMYEKVMNLLVIFLAFNFNNLVKTKMTYILNGLNTESAINNVDDIVNSNLDIGVPLRIVEYLEDEPRLKSYLKDHFVDCDFDVTCIYRTALQRDLISYRGVRKVRFEDGLIDKETGKWMLKQLPHVGLALPIFGQFKRGHPVFPRFNEKLQHLMQSGLVSKLISKYDKVRKEDDVFMASHKLGFDDIAAPNCLWLLGLMVSLVVFVWEVWLSKKFGASDVQVENVSK